MRDWSVGVGFDDVLAIPLHPPTERQVLADLPAVLAWVESWRSVAREIDGVETATRRWASVGTQEVPERVVLRGAQAVCAFAGGSALRNLRRLRERADVVRARFAKIAAVTGDGRSGAESLDGAIASQARALLDLPDAEFARLCDVLEWLVEHPVSGRRPRELPIRGVDTKWLGAHRRIVQVFHTAITARAALGLLAAPALARIRVLDPTMRPGGLIDITAPLDELGALTIEPGVVLVVENLETLLALPDLEGAVAVHGAGFGVDGRVAALPWARRVVYWGDLDSHGFAILNQLRSAVPDAESVLMDEATLTEHRDLWVPEPAPAVGVYSRLTEHEEAALARLRTEGGVRLEQERIPWATAIEAITRLVTGYQRGEPPSLNSAEV